VSLDSYKRVAYAAASSLYYSIITAKASLSTEPNNSYRMSFARGAPLGNVFISSQSHVINFSLRAQQSPRH
jgi:hypothetical protein